jgi:carbonic anhydrase/acetyltransferase-like protein (isoleucine patch superfamily)
MDHIKDLLLVGVRSPLVVDYEETCLRAGRRVLAGLSVSGEPRLFQRKLAVQLDAFDPVQHGAPFIACAFAPLRRQELAGIARGLGLEPADALVDPTAIIASTSRVGEGSYVNAGAIIGGLCLLGEGVLVNRAASLGHHVVVGDYASVGPGATLAGNSRVGAGAVIGAGAIIHPNVAIGANAIIAAGAVVRKDVPDGGLMSGNPAVLQPSIGRKSSIGRGDEE